MISSINSNISTLPILNKGLGILKNYVLIPSGCALIGYGLNKFNMEFLIKFAKEKMGLPIADLSISKQGIERNLRSADRTSINLSQKLNEEISVQQVIGDFLVYAMVNAIIEDLLFRGLINSEFSKKLIGGTAAAISSTLLFSLIHQSNKIVGSPVPQKQINSQMIHTFVLGATSVMIHNNCNLLSSIFTHIGYNLRPSQLLYGLSFPETTKSIRLGLNHLYQPKKMFKVLQSLGWFR